MKLKKILGTMLSLSLLASVIFSVPVSAAVSVQCDTTKPFSMKPGNSYTFRVTVSGSSAAPSLTVGDGSVLKVYPAGRSGNNYYFKVIATQVAGTATGVYTSIPGQSPVRQCIVSVVNSASGAIAGEQAPANGVWLYSLMPSQEITASKENNDSIYNGGDGHGRDCKQAVKYQFDLDRHDYDDSSADKDPDYATYEISYPLNGQYKTFSAILTGSLYDLTTHMKIIGDGKTLYETGFSNMSGLIDLNVDVSSISTLTFQFSAEYAPSSVEDIILSNAQLLK